MAITCPSQFLTVGLKGSCLDHLPCDEIGSITARNSLRLFLRHCLITNELSKASTSLTWAINPHRSTLASDGVKVSPLPVPSDLKKPTLEEERKTNRSIAIATSANGIVLGLIFQKYATII